MAYAFNDDKSKYDISNVASLISRIEELERQVGDFNVDVVTLQNAMSSLENNLSDFNDDITNLSNDIDAMSVIGTHYEKAKSVAITKADINTYAEGPSLTLPAGTYVVTGVWLFNSASGARTMETRLRWGTDNHAEGQRVAAPNGNYTRLNCAWTGTFKSETTVTLIGSATATSTAQTCYLNAVRVK